MMPVGTPENPGLLNWILILGLGVVWGTAFMSVGLALEGLGPLWVAAGRTGLAAVAMITGSTLLGQGLGRITTARAWSFVAVIGAGTIALPFALLAWGIQHVPSAFAGVTMGAVPLLVLPLVYIFSPEEGIGPKRIAGVALGFVGLVILVGPSAFSGGEDLSWLGGLACTGAPFCYAVGSVLTRRAPAMPPLAFATATMAVAALVLCPLALIVEGWPGLPPLEPALALLYCAIFPTALATFVRVHVIVTAGSLFTSLVSYMVPVWAVIFGVTLMGEDLPPSLFAALALILAGIALSQWRSLQAMVPRR